MINFQAAVNMDAGSLIWRTRTHFVLLHYEYQGGLIGLVSVVNPLHLQRLPQRDADGAAL